MHVSCRKYFQHIKNSTARSEVLFTVNQIYTPYTTPLELEVPFLMIVMSVCFPLFFSVGFS